MYLCEKLFSELWYWASVDARGADRGLLDSDVASSSAESFLITKRACDYAKLLGGAWLAFTNSVPVNAIVFGTS